METERGRQTVSESGRETLSSYACKLLTTLRSKEAIDMVESLVAVFLGFPFNSI